MNRSRVLHVTESMGGGVVTFMESISARQSDVGAEVAVLYAVRPDTPDRDVIDRRLGPYARLLPAVEGKTTAERAIRLFLAVRRAARSGDYDVIHLHSSVAGAAGRSATSRKLAQSLIVYSPHGFAFLREDKSRLNRTATLIVERALSARGPLVLTSASEQRLAVETVRAARTSLLQSGVPSQSIPSKVRRRRASRPRVIMLGRLAYQKAPWRFAHVARALAEEADFVWVGGGTGAYPREWLSDAPVQVIPWVDPSELDDLLDESDVLLFPTLWEGMSLSLIQAQSRGIPCVTSDVVGNRDAVVDRETGFVCGSDEALVEATAALVHDAALRERMGQAAREHALRSLTDDAIGSDSLALYAHWLADGAGARIPDKSRSRSDAQRTSQMTR